MQINRKFLGILLPILSELKEKMTCDFVVFGSAPLYLLGVLDFSKLENINDLDIAVGDDFIPSGETQEVLFHDDPRQRFYKIEIGGINIDIGPAWPGRERIYEKIFSSAFEVEGFRFASLNVVKEWKEIMVQEYGREKDQCYLEKIYEFQKYKAETIEIADAVAEDADEIIKLKNNVWVSAYTNHSYDISEKDIRSRESRNPERIAEMKELIKSGNDSAHIWIAKDKDEIIGMCAADKGEEKNKISALYILPSYQGVGIGTKLFEKALEWLGEEKLISLEVAKFNSSAAAFYSKFGFEVKEKADDYIFPTGKRMPLLRMEKIFNDMCLQRGICQ